MDIFKFTNPTAPTKMEQGQIIDGIDSKMWVERYVGSGEFTFTSPVRKRLRDKLPIGSFVSHVDTEKIMIVENHEINDDGVNEPNVVVTGRDYETFLENRVVCEENDFPISRPRVDFALSGYTHEQAVSMIQRFIEYPYLIDKDNELPFVKTISTAPDVGISIARTYPSDTVYKHVLDILAIDKLGIKSVRPGPWSPFGADDPNVAFVVYQGEDKTGSLAFSHDSGEIRTADYLWSNKKFKNAAFIFGKWVETVVFPDITQYDRRWMVIDASDIDNAFASPPNNDDPRNLLDDVVNKMHVRAFDVLSSQNDVAIAKVEAAHYEIQHQYRVDYNLGDLVVVAGEYNETAFMRVTEHVEIEDATGESKYPTFSLDGA